jgi:hypothetical protein
MKSSLAPARVTGNTMAQQVDFTNSLKVTWA